MKERIMVGFIASIFCLFSCKKNTVPAGANNPVIIGVWSIVSDSTYTGVGQNNHAVGYIGQSGDYFDIRSDGFVYTKEGAVLDTLKYTQPSDSTITIAGFGLLANGVQAVSNISNFSIHTLTISSPIAITPGGLFGRVISMKR
jgi:hypothetical protein